MLRKGLAFFVLVALAGCSTAEKQTQASPPALSVEKASAQQPTKDSAAKPKASAAKESSQASAESESCISGTDKRLLEISKTEKGGCELNYSKNGQASKVAGQIAGSQKCEEVKEKIKSKLVGAGFTCS